MSSLEGGNRNVASRKRVKEVQSTRVSDIICRAHYLRTDRGRMGHLSHQRWQEHEPKGRGCQVHVTT